MGPSGKAVVVFTLVGIASEAFMAGKLKEADTVHVEDRIPDYQRLERPLYTDASSSTGRTAQWGLDQDRMILTQLKDGRIQVIVAGSVSPVTLPKI
jgi:hypothetical protein